MTAADIDPTPTTPVGLKSPVLGGSRLKGDGLKGETLGLRGRGCKEEGYGKAHEIPCGRPGNKCHGRRIGDFIEQGAQEAREALREGDPRQA